MATRQSKIDHFVNVVANDCANAGITLIFKDVEHDDGKFLGSFSAEYKELVVATKRECWPTTLAHEYAHFLQMKEKVYEDETCYDSWENWLDGHLEFDAASIMKFCRTIQATELDAEKRAVKLIRQYGLISPQQCQDYIRASMAYIYLYEIERRIRKAHSPKRSPTEDKKYYGMLPAKFIKDFGRIPDDFEALVLDNCFD